jgi:hypothetical protein
VTRESRGLYDEVRRWLPSRVATVIYWVGQALGVAFILFVIVAIFVEFSWRDVLEVLLFIAAVPAIVALLIGVAVGLGNIVEGIGNRRKRGLQQEIGNAIDRRIATGEFVRRREVEEMLDWIITNRKRDE